VRRFLSVSIVLCGALAGTVPGDGLHAQETSVRLRGFGGWAYGRTNVNEIAGATPEGEYRRGGFALNLAATVSPKLDVRGQVEWRQDGAEHEVELDYGFAAYRLTRSLELRAGKVQHPFGWYSEVFEVGTVRPFLDLPQSIYGPNGFVSEAYVGVGVHGRVLSTGRFEIDYSAYAGGIETDEQDPGIEYLVGNVPEDRPEPGNQVDAVGGRVIISTPVTGLRVGISALTDRPADRAEGTRRYDVGVQAEYMSDRLWLRGELAQKNHPGDLNVIEAGASSIGGYVEAAYFVTPHWQAALQYEGLTTRLPVSVSPALRSLQHHRAWTVGLDYWLSPDLVFKASFQRIRGNRLALPSLDELADAVTNADLRPRTNVVQVGTQFSF
jgi:hypothetical protein